MNAGDKPQHLQQELRELEDRERSLRLRELELEIEQPATDVQVEVMPKESGLVGSRLRRWRRKIVMAAKFFGLVIAIIVAVRVAAWLAGAVMVVGIAWLAYQLFFDSDD
ncbi:MAG: hypothetical protein AAF704_16675 [Cyanobacteria bacterium P01_D01_bin.123]